MKYINSKSNYDHFFLPNISFGRVKEPPLLRTQNMLLLTTNIKAPRVLIETIPHYFNSGGRF